MQRHNNLYKLIILSFVLLTSCAVGLNTVSLTQKQQATIWMQTYNAQYDDTYRTMINPLSTEVQKSFARQKKAILTELWPLLIQYSTMVDQGLSPTEIQSTNIINLINKLTMLTTGGH